MVARRATPSLHSAGMPELQLHQVLWPSAVSRAGTFDHASLIDSRSRPLLKLLKLLKLRDRGRLRLLNLC